MKTVDIFFPISPGSIRLKGHLGKCIDKLIQNSVMAQNVERLIKPFRDKTEDGNCDWRTEYWGKWASGGALACRYKPTNGNNAVLKQAVYDLIATQDPDGYIGTRKPQHHLNGWDVWGRKYVLLGLLGYYDISKDDTVLKAARRHTDSLISECGPGKTNIAAIGYPMWKGLPPSSVLEPVVLLYKHTGKKKYLEFAEYIVGQWSRPNHWSPNGLRLIEDTIAGKPAAQIGEAPKSYEMMSCYEGLCELYRATGEKNHLEAPVKLAESIFNDELTIIGSGSAHELWCGSKNMQCGNEVLGIETCVTVTWMKFCFQLLRLTGDPKYAEALETSLYNALLGALAPQGQWWAYFTLLLGERVPSHQQHADVGSSCCVLSGPRGLLLTPSWAVMTNADGPVINLYNQYTVDVCLSSGINVRLMQKTNYPVDDHTMLRVQLEESASFTLSLRIPAWSKNTQLYINGKKVSSEVKPGTYTRIKRKWHDGDTVSLKFDMRGLTEPDPAGGNFFALKRGPIVLALDKRLCSINSKTALEPDLSNTAEITLNPNQEIAKKEGLWMAFDVSFKTKNGQKQTLTFCDFASAGNTWNKNSLYRVWLKQPLDLSSVWKNLPQWWKKTLPSKKRPKMPKVPAR